MNFTLQRLKYFPSIWLAFVFIFWNLKVSRSFEFNIALALASIVFVAPLVGALFTRQFFMGFDKLDSFPVRFTLGKYWKKLMKLECITVIQPNILYVPLIYKWMTLIFEP